MNKRLINFEALRILAMFMVLVLHYLDKGRILIPLAEPFSVNAYVAYFWKVWLLWQSMYMC